MKHFILIFLFCLSAAAYAQQQPALQSVTASYDVVKKEVVYSSAVVMPVDKFAEIDVKVKAIDEYIKQHSPAGELLAAFTDARNSLLQLRERYLVESERIIRDTSPYKVIK